MGVKCSNGGSVRTCKSELPHRKVRWGRLAEAGMEPEKVLLVRSLRGDAKHVIAEQSEQWHRIHVTGKCGCRQTAMLSVLSLLLCMHKLRGSVTKPRSKIRKPLKVGQLVTHRKPFGQAAHIDVDGHHQSARLRQTPEVHRSSIYSQSLQISRHEDFWRHRPRQNVTL